MAQRLTSCFKKFTVLSNAAAAYSYIPKFGGSGVMRCGLGGRYVGACSFWILMGVGIRVSGL